MLCSGSGIAFGFSSLILAGGWIGLVSLVAIVSLLFGWLMFDTVRVVAEWWLLVSLVRAVAIWMVVWTA